MPNISCKFPVSVSNFDSCFETNCAVKVRKKVSPTIADNRRQSPTITNITYHSLASFFVVGNNIFQLFIRSFLSQCIFDKLNIIRIIGTKYLLFHSSQLKPLQRPESALCKLASPFDCELRIQK